MKEGVNLKLDTDDDYLRRLVVFPDGQILAYGDDQGVLVCIKPPATTKLNGGSKKGGANPSFNVREIRQYDDGAIRALAVSSDGKRVAVGLDNGSTRIYQYDKYNDTSLPHPFVPASKGGNSEGGVDDDDDDDGDNGFLSQPDGDEYDDDDMEGNSWAGPQMETTVRDLKFLPNSHFLVISTESTSGVCVVNVSSAETMKDRYLESQVESVHDGCGVRGVDITSDNLQLMATLSLDGRLCVWKVSGLDQLKSCTEKVPVVRESHCCVTLKDIGEACGSSAADRACLPHWVSKSTLALPGKTELQLREVHLLNESLLLEESNPPTNSDPTKGHIEPISALTSQGNFIVSSGRDGRVILWELQEDEDGLPTSKFVQILGTFESMPTSLYWKDDTLLMACADGYLQVVTDMKRKAATTSEPPKTSVASSKLSTKETTKKETPPPASKSAVASPSKTSTRKPSSSSSALEKNDDEEKMKPKSSEKSPAKPPVLSSTKRPKITFSESTDEELVDSDNEKEESITKRPAPSQKSPEKEEEQDTQMQDLDEQDSTGPETQLPSVRKVLANLEDSDDDDDTPLSSPPAKSSPNKEKETAIQSEKSQGEDDDSDVEETVTKLPKARSDLDSDDDNNDDISTKEDQSKEGEEQAEKKARDSKDSEDMEEEESRSLKKPNSKVLADLTADTDSEDEKESKQSDTKGSNMDSEVSEPKDQSTKKRLVKQSKPHQDGEEEDDDIFEEDANTEQTKPSSAKVSFIDDEAEDSNDLEDDEDAVGVTDTKTPTGESTGASSDRNENTATNLSQEENGPVDATGDNQDSNDDGGFPIQDDDQDSIMEDIDAVDQNFQTSNFSGPHRAPVAALPEPQAPFAPSSTPLDLPRRFLCWNGFGSITLISDEMGHRSTVDINFTEKAFKRPISFTDNMGFILGSIGDDGAIFATDLANDDDDDLDDGEDDIMEGLSLSAQTKAALRKSQKQRMKKKGSSAGRPLGSNIYFHRFNTFASLKDKDWYLTLPDGELVLGCACGLGWAAAITSRKFLRLFTSGGCQGQILWLPGKPVTIVGRGRFLAVFYHESMPLADGSQNLGYMLFDAVSSRTVTKGSVCGITAGSSLEWAGFSNDCSLMVKDSDGMISMLQTTFMGEDENEPSSWAWSPLLDTVGLKKSTEDKFWPITVFDGKLVCIPLKGGTQYPDAARRPIPATLRMKMPLARSTLAKSSALEELSVRSNLALTQRKVMNDISCGDLMGDSDEEYRQLCAQVDKVTLKLFATTLEAGKLERALDIVSRLHLEKSYEIAMTIADNHHNLVDRIEAAKEHRFPPEEDEDDFDEDQEENYDDESNRHYNDINSSPQGGRSQSSQQISPDSEKKDWKTAKRIFGGQHGRNVRARAF